MSVNLPNVERELLQLIAEGDEPAYRQFFNQLWPNVYSAALRLTKSPELAQDLSQEVFLRVWEHRSTLPAVNNIYAFLYTITRNLVNDFLRMKVFREANRPFLINYFQYSETDPFGKMEQREQKQVLLDAIGRLPVQLQQVVRMAYLEGKNHKEIAVELHITPASSRIYLVRAIALLRKDSTSGNTKLFVRFLWLALVP